MGLQGGFIFSQSVHHTSVEWMFCLQMGKLDWDEEQLVQKMSWISVLAYVRVSRRSNAFLTFFTTKPTKIKTYCYCVYTQRQRGHFGLNECKRRSFLKKGMFIQWVETFLQKIIFKQIGSSSRYSTERVVMRQREGRGAGRNHIVPASVFSNGADYFIVTRRWKVFLCDFHSWEFWNLERNSNGVKLG